MKTFGFTCSFCRASENFNGEETFKSAWEAAKRAGWRAYKESEEWMRKYPKCAKKPREQTDAPDVTKPLLTDDEIPF